MKCAKCNIEIAAGAECDLVGDVVCDRCYGDGIDDLGGWVFHPDDTTHEGECHPLVNVWLWRMVHQYADPALRQERLAVFNEATVCCDKCGNTIFGDDPAFHIEECFDCWRQSDHDDQIAEYFEEAAHAV